MARLQRICLTVFASAVLLFLTLPSVIVVVMSFSTSRYLEFPPQPYGLVWYRSFFTSREWLAALGMSLRAALITMCLATAFGTMLARVLAFRKSGRGWSMLRALLLAPVIVPAALTGAGLFMLFAPLGLVNTLTGVVIAQLALALPFVVFTVSAGIEACDPDLERVAETLGATPAMAFWTVTLPQIRLSLLAERCLPSSPPSMNRLSPSSSPAGRTRPFRKRCSSISTRNWIRRSPQSPGWSSD